MCEECWQQDHIFTDSLHNELRGIFDIPRGTHSEIKEALFKELTNIENDLISDIITHRDINPTAYVCKHMRVLRDFIKGLSV
jgi:hypothetical protein